MYGGGGIGITVGVREHKLLTKKKIYGSHGGKWEGE
jgi:hypothetical protein